MGCCCTGNKLVLLVSERRTALSTLSVQRTLSVHQLVGFGDHEQDGLHCDAQAVDELELKLVEEERSLRC